MVFELAVPQNPNDEFVVAAFCMSIDRGNVKALTLSYGKAAVPPLTKLHIYGKSIDDGSTHGSP